MRPQVTPFHFQDSGGRSRWRGFKRSLFSSLTTAASQGVLHCQPSDSVLRRGFMPFSWHPSTIETGGLLLWPMRAAVRDKPDSETTNTSAFTIWCNAQRRSDSCFPNTRTFVTSTSSKYNTPGSPSVWIQNRASGYALRSACITLLTNSFPIVREFESPLRAWITTLNDVDIWPNPVRGLGVDQ